MNTTTAATQAHVTTATIRTWCRNGVITATKAAGRWIVDAASLARRIAIGAMRTHKPAARPVVYTVDTMTAIGGNRWTKNGMDRVYLNDWTRFAGLEVETYNSGNVRYAEYQGERVSNSQARLLAGSIDKVWFDAADGRLHYRPGYSESRVADRDEVFAAVVTGIRTAIAAL